MDSGNKEKLFQVTRGQVPPREGLNFQYNFGATTDVDTSSID